MLSRQRGRKINLKKTPLVTPETFPRRCNECFGFCLHGDAGLNKIQIDSRTFRCCLVLNLYIYIYIYIYFKRKRQNRSHRIINLFQSCYAFLKFPKTRKKKLTGLLQIFLIKKLEYTQKSGEG